MLLGNGVDLQHFHPATDEQGRREARADLGVDADAVVVGTVARLVWQKGFHELFEAAERLRDTLPDVVFVVVGGSDADKADAISSEQLAAAAHRGRIVFAGSRDDMEHVLPGIRSLRAAFPPRGLSPFGHGGSGMRSAGRRH